MLLMAFLNIGGHFEFYYLFGMKRIGINDEPYIPIHNL